MSNPTVYSCVVHVFENEDGKYQYAISQEFEEGDNSDWQLLETGERDTPEEAIKQASESIKTLFVA